VVSGAVLAAQTTAPVEIRAMRRGVVQGTTRIVIEFSGEFEYHRNRLRAPERIYFDFPMAKLRTGPRTFSSKELSDESIRVRVAEPAPGMTRVVLDLLEEVDVSTAKLKEPDRLLIELRPTVAPTSQIRKSIPPLGDNAPKPAPDRGATPPLKPLSLALTSGTGPEPVRVQAQPGLGRRHALRLSPISAAPGSIAAVRLDLDSPAGGEPQALQWELSYPSPMLGIEDGDLVAGGVASSAGKSLACAGRVESAGAYIYRCILAGGLKTVPNGTVAVINFRVRSYARSGPATVRISNALAVAADGKEVLLQPNEADVTIR
jgi:hypothetical protein